MMVEEMELVHSQPIKCYFQAGCGGIFSNWKSYFSELWSGFRNLSRDLN